MGTLLQRGPADMLPTGLPRKAARIIVLTVALVLVYAALAALFGRNAPVQAVLYAAFPIACTIAAGITSLKRYSRAARIGFVIVGASIWYALSLALTVLSTQS